jgi:hypothetical protein
MSRRKSLSRLGRATRFSFLVALILPWAASVRAQHAAAAHAIGVGKPSGARHVVVDGEHPGLRSSDVSTSAVTATRWFDLSPAGPGLFWIATGLWAASAATSIAILGERSDLRVEAGQLIVSLNPNSADDLTVRRLRSLNDDYVAKSWAALLVAGSINALAVGSALLTLPQRESLPWWAWTLGGVGAAMAATSVSVWATVGSCSVTNSASSCRQWVRDSTFAPLLLIHSAAPLSVGLTYLLAQLTRSQVDVAVRAGADQTTLQLRGRF